MEVGNFPYFRAISASHGATEVTIEGRRVLMIGSNNYLGLTTHPKVTEAALVATREFGTGCSGSRFLNGTLELHHRLEERLARFVGKEKALVFSTGFQTNLGTLSVIAGREDIIFCDRENHASIFDGVRLSFANVLKYRHNDMEDLERLLAQAPAQKGKLIVADGIFSMVGDLVNLPRMKELADRYDAKILVDDAHAVGVIGEGGRGTASHFGIDVDLITGTFSKSLASLGGFVAGAGPVIDYIQFTARAMCFSAAMTPANAAAALAALDVMESEPQHRERLLANVAFMRKGFRELGYAVEDHPSAIIALPVGEDEAVFHAWRRLFEQGIFTNPVVAPAVPAGQGLLRTSYMATHTREQLERALEVFSRLARELHLVP
ncbi:MAG: aminotransferase class I/II-fold pyridoxal phosphate-dependent enzyme [Planctomycetes bacterium]|nr:aminotransferase class I/II-fold pyridoxal phosphate-dependent enzyme [Planctomycetota bacterium]